MLKRLFNYLKRPLDVTVLRRYRITSGNVGELYVDGKCVSDSLDTFGEYDLGVRTVALYDDFVQLKRTNTLTINAKELDGRRVVASLRNNWVDDH